MPYQGRSNEIYGNWLVLSDEGVQMFRCIEKKARWYLKRNLAKIITESPPVLQLLFKPKGNGWDGDEYYLAQKANTCVKCNHSVVEDLTRHHIVPLVYRKAMPDTIKSHSSFDIMPLCIPHHEEYEFHAYKLKNELALKYDAPLVCGSTPEMKYHLKIRGMMRTYLHYRDEMPEEKTKSFRTHIEDFLQTTEFTDEDISRVLAETPKVEMLNVNHGKIVMSKVTNLQEFVEMWRYHFLEHVQPKFLPIGWNPKRTIYYKQRSKALENQRETN